MNKIVAVLSALMLMAGVAMASDFTDKNKMFDVQDQQVIEVDAPYLVQVGDQWFLGTSISKDVKDTAWQEGFILKAKVTYRGTILKLFGK